MVLLVGLLPPREARLLPLSPAEDFCPFALFSGGQFSPGFARFLSCCWYQFALLLHDCCIYGPRGSWFSGRFESAISGPSRSFLPLDLEPGRHGPALVHCKASHDWIPSIPFFFCSPLFPPPAWKERPTKPCKDQHSREDGLSMLWFGNGHRYTPVYTPVSSHAFWSTYSAIHRGVSGRPAWAERPPLLGTS